MSGTGLMARVRLGRSEKGVCVIASEPIAAGSIVLEIHGDLIEHPDRYSLQMGHSVHVAVPKHIRQNDQFERYGWRFVNHSCMPTVMVHHRTFTAIRDVAEGEEISFDYNTTEWDMSSPFDCSCGTAACVGRVRGYKHLGRRARTQIEPHVAEYLRTPAVRPTPVSVSVPAPTPSPA